MRSTILEETSRIQAGSFFDSNFVQRGHILGAMNNTKHPQIDHAGLAERLEILRSVIGLDKGEFSLSFGVDPSSYTKIINGTKPLKADAAYALSERWNVSMDFIYRGKLDKLPDRYAKAVIERLTQR